MRYFGLALALLLTAGCDSGGDEADDMESGSLILSVSQMAPLPEDYHLEGWVTTLTSPARSIGKFAIDASGALVDLRGNPIEARRFETDFSLDSAQVMYITIEPPGDADSAPSDTRLMGGLFIDGQVSLSAADFEGIEDELILAAGTYIVDTPTDGPDTNNDSGIWFVNLTGGPPARGLRVAIPIQGWQYQAWTEFDDIAVNMGIITHHSRPDDSSVHSGSQPGYNYPGEDFLINAPPGLIFPLSVEGTRVYVTLEPEPDPDPDPSQFVLFEARVPGEILPGQTHNMANLIDRFPTGTAVVID
ncbi:MAG: hypothetical protein OXU68_15275 [Bacteroidota bacterium]|nr:hypothetical protein [Bacteroidota bacterium]